MGATQGSGFTLYLSAKQPKLVSGSRYPLICFFNKDLATSIFRKKDAASPDSYRDPSAPVRNQQFSASSLSKIFNKIKLNQTLNKNTTKAKQTST